MRLRALPGLLAAALVVAAVSSPARLAGQAERAGGEVRGLWVLRTSLASPKNIEAVVRAAESGGFNALLVQVRGRGEAYYQSAIEPRATDLDAQPQAFDPLALTLDLAHRAGLRVHAWVNVDLVASATTLPRSREHVVSRHPDWLMIPKPLAAPLRRVDLRSPAYVGELARWTRGVSTAVEGLYLSPIPADAQAYTVRVVEELVSKYAIDGLHLDYARYPNELFDYSARALAEFRATKAPQVSDRERQRLDRAAAVDPAAWAEMFPEGWSAFRRDRLTALVRRLRDTAKAARPAIVVSAAVAPNADDARTRRLQDWSAWAAAGVLDAVCPMAYTTELATFSDEIAGVRRAAGRVPVWAGIGAWQLPVHRTVEHVRAARRAGVSGVLLFSYDGLTAASPAQTYFSGLREALLGTTPR